MGRHRLPFGENMPGKTPKSASPKILQLELWREMFSAKYGLSGPIKRV